MVGEVFINGKDAQKTFGVSFGSDSLSALLTYPPVKAPIENKSALQHGKRVVLPPDGKRKVEERDVQLTFNLQASGYTQFLTRYSAFLDELTGGWINIRTKYQAGVIYRCLYVSCSQFTQYNGRLAKFILKLNEPNPANRAEEEQGSTNTPGDE